MSKQNMGLYDQYKSKVSKNLGFSRFLKAAKIPGIILASAAAATFGFFAISTGSITEEPQMETHIAFGEEIVHSDAKVMFGSANYYYALEGSDDWSTEAPTAPGTYVMKTTTTGMFGGQKDSETITFTIGKKAATLSITSSTIKYGTTPEYSIDLIDGDKVSQIDFIYNDISLETTKVKADLSTVKIVDRNGNDVTNWYELNAEESDITFEKVSVDVTISSIDKTYDNISYDLVQINNTALIGQDTISFGNLVYYTISDEILPSSPVNSGKYKATLNKEEIKIYNGETNVTCHYDINVGFSNFEIKKAKINIPAKDNTVFYYDGNPHTYVLSFDERILYSNNLTQTNAGSYDVTMEIKDKVNFYWDNEEDIITYQFIINKIKVDKPIASTTTFTYTGNEALYELESSDFYTISNNKQTSSGTYSVIVSLNDKINYAWSDLSTDDLVYEFIINDQIIQKPSSIDTIFTYNGLDQTYDLALNDVYTITGNTQRNAGTYEVVVSLNDKDNYVWNDLTTEDLTYEFVINDQIIQKPSSIDTIFTYNGLDQTYDLALNDVYTITGNTKRNAGTYEVVVSLNDKDNYAWNDLTTEDLTYEFVIEKKDVEIYLDSKFIIHPSNPNFTIDNNSVYYDDGLFQYNIINKNYTSTDFALEEGVRINNVLFKLETSDEGYTTALNAGNYFITAQIGSIAAIEGTNLDNYNIQINDGIFNIKPREISLKAIEGSKYYDGLVYTYGTNSNYEVVSGSFVDGHSFDIAFDTYFGLEKASAKNVGTYTIEFRDEDIIENISGALKNNYKITCIPANYVINKAKVSIGLSSDYILDSNNDIPSSIYDGLYRHYVIEANNYEATGIISGESFIINNVKFNGSLDSVVNAGTYTLTLTKEMISNAEGTSLSNYEINLIDNGVLTYQIDKMALDKAYFDAKVETANFKFDGTPKDVIFKPLYEGIEGFTVQYSTINPTESGDYDIFVTTVESQNFVACSFKLDTKLHISINTPTKDDFIAQNLVYTFDNNPHVASVGAKKTGIGEISVEYQDSNGVVTSNAMYAGEYKILVSVGAGANFEALDDIVLDEILVINKAIPTINDFEIINNEYFYEALTERTITLNGISEITSYNIYYNDSTAKPINVGSYLIKVVTFESANYLSTTLEFSQKLVIKKALVAIPEAITSTFTYTGSEQIYNLDESPYYRISNNKQTKAGTYEVTVSLNDSNNYEWSDGKIDNLTYSFVINKKNITIPTADIHNPFTYTSNNIEYVLGNNTDNSYYDVINNNQTNVNDYTVVVRLKDTDNTCWSDGKSNDLEFSFSIKKALVAIPEAITSTFTYTGSEQIYNLDESSYYTISNNKQTKAGTYEVTVSLNDSKNYEWSDGKIDNLIYQFEIKKQLINKPNKDTTNYVYNATSQQYNLTLDSRYTISNDTQKDAGEYRVVVRINDPDDYCWEDGSNGDLEYIFTIKPQTIDKPIENTSEFIFNKTNQTYTLTENSLYTISKNVYYDAGEYPITISINDKKNYEWSDHSTADVIYTFIIKQKEIDIPSPDLNVYTYNGANHTYQLVSNADYYTISNNTQKDAGTYTVVVSLIDKVNTKWEDGTTNDKEYHFVINKISVEKPEEDSTIYVYNDEFQTYVLAENANYSVSGNYQKDAKTYDVIISLKDTVNYEWSDHKTDPLTYKFVINKATITKPVADTTLFTYNGSEQTYNLSENSLYEIKGNHQTNYGNYDVTVEIIDKDNYMWKDDSSTSILHFGFNIAKAKVSKPIGDPTFYVYDGNPKNYTFTNLVDSSFYEITGSLEEREVGKYDIKVSLKDKNNICWNDFSSDDLVFEFYINDYLIEIPSIDETIFTYNGDYQTYSVGTNPAYEVEGNLHKDAGTYDVIISLVDSSNFAWEDGTKGDLTYEFVINKATIEKPVADTTVFTYNGSEQTYNLSENSLYEIEGNKQTNYGNYDVTVEIIDKDNYMWKDGTNEDLKFDFDIARKVVSIPTSDTTIFTYNGSEQTYQLSNLVDSDFYTITGNKTTIAGTHEVIVSLNDKVNSVWEGNTVSDLTYEFVINKAIIDIPSYDLRTFTYNGVEQEYYIKENSLYTVTGNKETKAGEYQVIVSLNNMNYEWSNHTQSDLKYDFNIAKKVVEIPVADLETYTYNGSLKTYQLTNLGDSAFYTVSGNTATDAGSYTVTVTLDDKESSIWSDYTNSPKTYSFDIAKAKVEKPVAISQLYEYNGEVQTYQLTNLGDSALYSINGLEQTEIGDHLITVSLNNSKNYEWKDGEIGDIYFTFSITRKSITIPTPVVKTYKYNGSVQEFLLENLDDQDFYKIVDNYQLDADTYYVKISLNNTTSSKWADGSDREITYEFTIEKLQMELSLTNIEDYHYDANYYSYPSSQYFISGDSPLGLESIDVLVEYYDFNTKEKLSNKPINAGKYIVKASGFNINGGSGNEKNYDISFGEDEKVFEIIGANITIKPSVSFIADSVNGSQNLIYSGHSFIYLVNNDNNFEIVNGKLFGTDKLQISQVNAISVLNAGIYNYEILDVISSSGTNINNYNITFESLDFEISKVNVDVSLDADYSFTYDGLDHYYAKDNIVKYTNGFIGNDSINLIIRYNMNDSITSMKEPGSYKVYVASYEANDSTNVDNYNIRCLDTVNVVVDKVKVDLPAKDETKFIYNGENQTYQILPSSYYSITNNVQKDVGTYDVIISLNDDVHYIWSDGSTNNVIYSFTITQKVVTIVLADIPTKEYDGSQAVHNCDVIDISGLVSSDTFSFTSSDINYYVYSSKTKKYNKTSSAVNVGKYQFDLNYDNVIVTDQDGVNVKNNYIFTCEAKSFEIIKHKVVKPVEDNTEFTYTGSPLTYYIAPSEYYSDVNGNLTQINANENGYEIRISLNNKNNLEWDDGTTEDIRYYFVIHIKYVEKPSADPTNGPYVYNGSNQTFNILGDTANYAISNNVKKDAGDYKVTVNLKNTSSMLWTDGTSDTFTYDFEIAKAQVEIPEKDSRSFIYNGEKKTYSLSFDENIVEISDNYQQTNAGSYCVELSIMNTKNYEWEDGTVASKSYDFNIAKAKVEKPEEDLTIYTFNNTYQTYKLISNSDYQISGETVRKNAGTTEITISLKNKQNYEWSDHTSDDIIYEFIINKANVVIKPQTPEITQYGAYLKFEPNSFVVVDENDNNKFFGEDMKAISVAFQYYDAITHELLDDKPVNAGGYLAQIKEVSGATNNYDIDYSAEVYFEISVMDITAPSINPTTFTYNGYSQTYTLPNSSYYEINDNVQTEAGTYVVTVSLKDKINTSWYDTHDTEDKTYNFVINPRVVEASDFEIVANDLTKQFDGSIKSVGIISSKFNFNSNTLPSGFLISYYGENLGNTTPIEIDKYKVYISISGNTNYVDVSNLEIGSFEIVGYQIVPIPSVDINTYTYNREPQTYQIEEKGYYTISNHTFTDAGEYEITVSLNDKDNYRWSDNTNLDKTYSFVIEKKNLFVDSFNVSFEYDMSEVSEEEVIDKLSINDQFINEYLKNNNLINIEFDQDNLIVAGKYTAHITIGEFDGKDNYYFESIESIPVHITIDKTVINLYPTPITGQKTYDGEKFSYSYTYSSSNAFDGLIRVYIKDGYVTDANQYNEILPDWYDYELDSAIDENSVIIEKEKIVVNILISKRPTTIFALTNYVVDKNGNPISEGSYEWSNTNLTYSIVNGNYEATNIVDGDVFMITSAYFNEFGIHYAKDIGRYSIIFDENCISEVTGNKSNYEWTVETSSTFRIVQRSFYVESTASYTFDFDDDVHYCNDFVVDDTTCGLLPGYSYEVIEDSCGVYSGEKANNLKFIIYDEKGNQSSNYKVVILHPGTLTVIGGDM